LSQPTNNTAWLMLVPQFENTPEPYEFQPSAERATVQGPFLAHRLNYLQLVSWESTYPLILMVFPLTLVALQDE